MQINDLPYLLKTKSIIYPQKNQLWKMYSLSITSLTQLFITLLTLKINRIVNIIIFFICCKLQYNLSKIFTSYVLHFFHIWIHKTFSLYQTNTMSIEFKVFSSTHLNFSEFQKQSPTAQVWTRKFGGGAHHQSICT